jgi:2-keto-4-pentenoate hydratase/2-oxohepta-3-ene-1,7-dioic acid hydratase in catechol pathway
MKIPTVPVIFSKAPTTVSGPYDDVAVDRAATQQVDWEVELGVVIGKTGRNIAKADALGQVFGYTGDQRSQRARSPAAAHAVVQGEEPRRVLPDGAGRGDR